jgi:hypothetical protein
VKGPLGGCGPLGCPWGDCVGPTCHMPGTDDDDDGSNSGRQKLSMALDICTACLKPLVNSTDSNDPHRVESSSAECTTSIVSSCRTLCVADATTTCGLERPPAEM